MDEKQLHFRTILEGVLVAGVVTVILLFGGFEKIEGWILNTQFSLRGPLTPKSPIIIVSIDEDSFDELEFQWPWPRSVHAEFLNILQQGRPTAIGLNILFIEPSALGPEDDVALGEAIRDAGNVILAAAQSVVESGMYRKADLNAPVASIRKHAAGYGPVNLPTDNDAFIRRAQTHLMHQGTAIKGFDALLYQLAQKAGLSESPFQQTQFIINFRGRPRTFETVPYYRVLNGEIPPAYFYGKIVFVGSTTPLLHDSYPTPFAPTGDMPGVEIHANILETMLQNDPIEQIPLGVTVFVLLLAGPLAIRITNRFRPLFALSLILVLIGIYWAVGFAGFSIANVWVDAIPLPLCLVLGYGTSVIQNFIREQREKRQLSQYFSPSVLTDIFRHRKEGTLGSQRRVVTVLFSDIRGFTFLSQKIAPEQVAAFLHEYLTEMTDVVFEHGGTVDKYMGDSIMALYNAPFDQPDHAHQALKTAFEFQRRLKPLAKKLKDAFGWDLEFGVGIHTGEAVVGTLGSQQRFEYTAIGDTINLGARLESLTKQYRVPIIMSESTYEGIREQYETKFLGTVEIQGREHPERIYAALNPIAARKPSSILEEA
ncbi:adenylate/guanylate cyclase domain-containing protein [Candidatus Nitronereus thalassa]|uniref:Adenylate/guanylate cyclase domain-containing protein n=1 Tax=Candidatus Nitronereus thalassa TaxID=3020898 RepID=A0ABU3K9L6_9BACT|nr:adenylate/guanylate cyclase domain-containing protein [Candidatus Nitronereus thalassa]MDT7042998.1 adenylate/guanylate cyclase domain-containing protein [Candidatus Nitronereus thalassa]